MLRITKSRSLISYTANEGLLNTSNRPSAYDEDYSYDPNGNLLTLQRHDDQGNLMHDFDYLYFQGSNRLRQVEPPVDKVYDGGAIVSNTELYRKITIQGNAYIPQGKSVELRALEEIEIDPDFQSPDGTDFWAHIVADSGMYQYDAIGNLVLDQYDGVKISWTPYGKVREVKTKSDSVVVSFRYDGTGNRIEKRVVKPDTTYVTTYVRDASGNVMAIYNNALLTEQPIYGSSRLGMYRGGRYNGQRNLGEKVYELNNHLGNVLAVITDNIDMLTYDSVWATVRSTRDYYPFGLEMQGRTWSDTTDYRYGFNGKEKDDRGEFGGSMYDYGFRIYNPGIGRFLSVDPLFSTYPMFAPYQFASNTPISAIDRDGLEAEIVINSPWFYNNIKAAWDAGDVDKAQRLAWISIKRHRPPDINGRTTIKDMYKGALRAGTYNWNEANPDVLTVFDSDGNEMFRIFRADPPAIVEEEEQMGLWTFVTSLFDWHLEGKGSTQSGGMHFYAEGGKGFTKAKSKHQVESEDITVLYTYFSTTKFGPSGPLEFKIEEFINSAAGATQSANDLYDKFKETPASMDSSTNPYNSQVGKPGTLRHVWPVVPTKRKFTERQMEEELQKQSNSSNE